MSTEPFVGQISMFGGNFAPRNWALCNGQTLSIAQNSALFAILGTTYGGNGVQTFQLPNLQGRVPMHWGQGNGLTPRVLGEVAGTETVTLISQQMPIHNHTFNVTSEDASGKNPSGNFLAGAAASIYATPNNGATLNPSAVGQSGGSQPHDNMQPYLAITFIIALVGVFPSRN